MDKGRVGAEEEEEKERKKNRDREQTVRNKEKRSGGTRCRVREERRGNGRTASLSACVRVIFREEEPFFSAPPPLRNPLEEKRS